MQFCVKDCSIPRFSEDTAEPEVFTEGHAQRIKHTIKLYIMKFFIDTANLAQIKEAH
jgi:hypothetical protein